MRRCWYFEFEGLFEEDTPKNYNKGVISSCLVPENEYNRAEKLFFDALKRKKIHLLQIMDCFSLDETSVDINNNDNEFWIDWYSETILLNEVSFEKMYVFPKEEIEQ